MFDICKSCSFKMFLDKDSAANPNLCIFIARRVDSSKQANFLYSMLVPIKTHIAEHLTIALVMILKIN